MALTYRTGSGEHPGKGSALTIEELDNNFRHFTGSHSITGSLIISSSLIVSGSMGISGSIIPDGAGVHSLGSADNYFKDLYLSSDSLIFVSGSTSSSFSIDPSGSLSGSFDGDFTGSFTGSGEGDFTGSFIGSVDTQFNSGSCLIGCTSSVAPTGTRQEGTFEFVASGSGENFIFVYLGGAWRSGSLS
jgi:hypothetical protein